MRLKTNVNNIKFFIRLSSIKSYNGHRYRTTTRYQLYRLSVPINLGDAIIVEIDDREISHVLEGVLAQQDDHVAAEIDLGNTVEIAKSALVKLVEPPILEHDHAQILQLVQQLTGHVVEATDLTHRKRQFFEMDLRCEVIPHGILPLELAQYPAIDVAGVLQANIVAVAVHRCLLALNIADVHLLRLLDNFLFAARLRHRQTGRSEQDCQQQHFKDEGVVQKLKHYDPETENLKFCLSMALQL